ncbi:MAG TPA: UvrD-helicase domain-containing protein [Elusimicrobiota bacterium]|nr:UvrD-helicase domain-containing protein [Elusimicrobiota bacterium]
MTWTDADSRERARFLLTRNVVVEAGAGTGKTTLLTDRILSLLLAGGDGGPGIEITRLAAVTFTEKAAGEIKLRLSNRLADMLSVLRGRSLPEKRRREAEEWLRELKSHYGKQFLRMESVSEAALQNLDRAQIGTIHHFASHLLKLFPVEAGVSPRFEVDDGPVFDDIFEEEWARWLDQELSLNAPRRNLWLEILDIVPLDDLEGMARVLAREGARQGELGMTSGMIAALEAFAERFRRIPAGKPVPARGSRILESFEEVSAHLDRTIGSVGRPVRVSEEFSAARFAKKAWPGNWERSTEEEDYLRGVRLADQMSAEAETVVRKAVSLLLPIADHVREKYGRLGYLDYDGLLTKARALVRDRVDVRQELKERFKALVIDEFQDTDPVQGEILLFIGEQADSRARRWQDIRIQPGKLCVVGDPKQSIYRFRGADLRAYEQFVGLLRDHGAEKCILQTNFRSHSGLLDPINAIFKNIMAEKKELQPAYHAIHPKDPGQTVPAGLSAELVLVRDPSGPHQRITSESARRAEARWMARWIRAHCLPVSPDASELPLGRYRYRDVAVLLRTTTPLGIYLEAFKEHDIPYAVESDRYFYQTQEIVDFLNLLRVLDDPSDEISLVGLWRSPLVLLTDADVTALCRSGAVSYEKDPPARVTLSSPGKSRLREFNRMMRRLRADVGRVSLDKLVASVLNDSFLIEQCATAYHREQTVSNLLKLARLALESCQNRAFTLKEFIQSALQSSKGALDEGESPLADEHLDAVRILTIHKAKGLEFPVVMLPNLSGGSGGRGRKRISIADWSRGTVGLRLPKANVADMAMALMEEEEAERQRHELTRLFYVAMTRAREHLVLLGNLTDTRKSTFAALLKEAGAWPDPSHRPERIELDSTVGLPVSYLDPSGRFERIRPAARPGKKVLPLDGKVFDEAWATRRKEKERIDQMPVFISPTASVGEDEKWPALDDGDALSMELGGMIGQVCHRVLEIWDFKKGGVLKKSVRTMCRILACQYPLVDWARVETESALILKKFLRSTVALNLASCEVLGREIPFIYPQGDQVMRGRIDLIYRQRGRLWIADYKSDRILSSEIDHHSLRYIPQGRAYVRALEKTLGESPGFQLIFLRPAKTVPIEI